MTISSGGFNVEFSPTPTIYQQQVSGQHDLQNEANIGRGNVVIVPQSQQNDIPFSQLDQRNIWNYKSDSGHPTLLAQGQLRGATGDPQVRDDSWQPAYEELLNQLPEDVQNAVANAVTPEAVVLKEVLQFGARGLDIVNSSEKSVAAENAVNRAKMSQGYAEFILANARGNAEELQAIANHLLDEIGPNDPHYSETNDYLGSVQRLYDGYDNAYGG